MTGTISSNLGHCSILTKMNWGIALQWYPHNEAPALMTATYN